MRIQPEVVHSIRAVVTWVLRLAGVGLIVLGAYLSVQRIAFGIATGQPSAAWEIYSGIGESHGISRGIAMILIGAVLGLSAPFVSAWAVVVPKRGCPRCGYAGGDTARCPECGLTGLREGD